MAWHLITENVITQFLSGTFEEPKTSWGTYSLSYGVTINPSTEHVVEGSNAGKLEGAQGSGSLPSNYFWGNGTHAKRLFSFSINIVAGKRYKLVANVGYAVWPHDNGTAKLAISAVVDQLDVVSAKIVQVSSIAETFDTIEMEFEASSTGAKTVEVFCMYTPSSTIWHPPNEQVTFIDALEAGEYVEGHTASYFVTHSTQFGANNGAINVSVFNGSGDFSYAWADGPTTQDRTNLAPGFYTITITDNITEQVVVLENIQVLEPDEVEIFVEVETVEPFCNGSATGAINLTSVTGGDGGPFNFVWDDGPTTQDRANIPAGNYAVTVSDGSNNSVYIDDIVVGQPDPIQITASVEGQNINVTVSGGTPPYTYSWADGPTTKNRTNLDPGEYTITVTDNNGCTNEATVTVAQFRFFFARNPVVLELSADAPETKDNLSFLCEVHIEENYNTGVFSKITTLENPADDNGETVFDVQSILDGFEPLKRYLPAFNQSVMTIADSIFKRFFLAHTEKYGIPPAAQNFTEEIVNFMVLGGLSYEEYASDYFFTNYLDEVKPFFTWQLPQKYAFNDQPEFLFFMVPQFTVSELNVKVDLHLIDGQIVNLNAFTQSDVNRYEIYCIPAGFQQLLLDQQSDYDLVDKWQVYVEDQNGTRISQVKTYYMIHDYYPRRRFFLFRNSLGGMDTFVATGMAELKMKTKVEKIDKLLPHDYNISDGQIQITKKTADMEMDLTSGYLWQRAELERAQDFLKSEDVFEMINGRYVPVEIEGGGVVSTDDAGPVSIKFTAIPPRVENYTPFLGNNVDGGAQPVDPQEYLLVNSTLLRINRG